jgi:hypothetical protein
VACLCYQERNSLIFSCDLTAECGVMKISEFQKWALLKHEESYNVCINYIFVQVSVL